MNNYDSTALGCGMVLGIAVGLLATAFCIYCYWRICAKAGYGGAMSLLALLPGVGAIILMCILAFGKWPAIPSGADRQGGPAA